MTAYYSSLAMVTSAVLYLVAVAIFGAEWAAARSARPARELVAVGAGVAEPVGAEAEPGVAEFEPSAGVLNTGVTPVPTTGLESSPTATAPEPAVVKWLPAGGVNFTWNWVLTGRPVNT